MLIADYTVWEPLLYLQQVEGLRRDVQVALVPPGARCSTRATQQPRARCTRRSSSPGRTMTGEVSRPRFASCPRTVSGCCLLPVRGDPERAQGSLLTPHIAPYTTAIGAVTSLKESARIDWPIPERTRVLMILAALFVLAASVWGYVGLHLGRAAVHARALYSQALALRASGPGNRRPRTGAAHPAPGGAGLRRTSPLLAASQRLAWLPVIGPWLRLPRPRRRRGGLLEVASVAWGGSGEPFLGLLADDGRLRRPSPAALAGLAGKDGALRAAPSARRPLCGAWPQWIRPPPARLREPWARAREGLPLLIAAIEALPHLPAELGADGERAYLLLAQNNDEIRGAGGFLSSIGTLRLSDGAIAGFDLEDSYRVDNWSKPHDDPPEPLRRYMELDLLVTRDANWWPDFPTSARRVADLYASERDLPVEAVVAADVHAAARLLETLAPLELAGGQRLERGAVEEGLRHGWGLPDEAL